MVFHDQNLPSTPLIRGDDPTIIETAAQAYVINDLLYFDTNGTVAIATRTSGNLNSTVAGLATAKATGVTGAQVKIRGLRKDDILRCSVWHATAASAITAQTQLGVIYRVRYDTAALPTGTGGK